MEKILILCSALVSAVFLVALIGTFFVQDEIRAAARELVVERTTKYSAKAVRAAEELLQSPMTAKLLSEQQFEAIEGEIGDYKADPIRYVERLTSESEVPPPSRLVNKLSQKFFSWKESLRNHYNRTLKKLVKDLRIFCGTNIVAGLLGVILAFKSQGGNERVLLVYCGVLLFAIGTAVYSYIDRMGFFTILLDNFMGWEYPLVIAFAFIGSYWYFKSYVEPIIDEVSGKMPKEK